MGYWRRRAGVDEQRINSSVHFCWLSSVPSVCFYALKKLLVDRKDIHHAVIVPRGFLFWEGNGIREGHAVSLRHPVVIGERRRPVDDLDQCFELR